MKQARFVTWHRPSCSAALPVPIVFGALLLIQGAGLIILALRVRA